MNRENDSLPSSRSDQPGRHEGTVVRIDARIAHVACDGDVVPCALRGRLFEELADETRPLAVGDRVEFSRGGNDQGVIESRAPRTSEIVRPAAHSRKKQVIAANADLAVIVASTKDPPLRLGLLDRMLVAAERAGIESLIVINKVDRLQKPEGLDALMERYEKIGYRWIPTSAKTGTNIDRLGDALRDQISLLMGHSGVGKSSLLNAIQPGLGLRTNEVSERRRSGRHTTTHTSLLPLGDEAAPQGYVIDTPGIREFGLIDIEPLDLASYFPEMAPLRDLCHFANCLHVNEPDCAIQNAVDREEIAYSRYESYIRLLEGLAGRGERAPRHDAIT